MKQYHSNYMQWWMVFLFFPPYFLSFSPPSFFLLNIVHYPLNWLKDMQKDYHLHWKESHSVEKPKIYFLFSHPSPISSFTYSVCWDSYWAVGLGFFREIMWNRGLESEEAELKSLALWLTNWVTSFKWVNLSSFPISKMEVKVVLMSEYMRQLAQYLPHSNGLHGGCYYCL